MNDPAILQSEAGPGVNAIAKRPILNAVPGVLFGLTRSQFTALTIATIAPGVFTVASWAHSRAVRHYSLPLVIAEICLVACCLGSGLPIVSTLRRAPRIALAAAAGLVWVGALATGLVAPHPIPALLHFGITFVELILGFSLWGAFMSTWAGFQRRFLIAIAIGILYEVVLGYGLALSARGDPNVDWVSFHAGTTHVRQIGFYGTALCGLSAGLLATAETPFKRLCYLALATIGFAWNDLSGGRAAFVAGFAGCGLVWALAPASRKRLLGVELLASFGIAVPLSLIYIPSSFWGFWRILDGLTPHAGYATGRLTLWLTAFKGIVASPWIGHGEDQFHYAITQGPWNHPHNSLLQLLYQWGIIGTSCVFVIVTPILARVRHGVSRYPDIILPALGPLCGLVMMSLFEGSLYHVFPLMIVIVSLAVLASCSIEPIDSRAGATSPTPASAVAPST